MNKIFPILLLLSLWLTSCNHEPLGPGDDRPDPVSLNDLIVPPGFSFETASKATFSLSAFSNAGEPLKNVRLNLYTDFPDQDGILLASGFTGENGIFSGSHPIPAYADKLVATTNYLGLPNALEVEVVNGQITAVFGSPQTKSMEYDVSEAAVEVFMIHGIPFIPMGPYNAQGVPLYLDPVNEIIDQAFLDDINASFPESQPVPLHNPHYLNPDNQFDLLLQEAADVWVAFVHEGASWRNVLGYYTYVPGQPPTSPQDIEQVNVIFPNVSFPGSGGALQTGNRVHLGTFEANTAIGWVLIANGFQTANGRIVPGQGMYFSNPDLNPEQTPEKRHHAVHLKDMVRNRILLGFEDMNRDGRSDDDFNDAMFLISSNPVQAIFTDSFQPITYEAGDSDGDGVPDHSDDFPNDSDIAFISYYPSETGWGSLAFEDLWPGMGDFDFNDVVVDYRFRQMTNASNQVVKIIGNFRLRALGSSYRNGFGFSLPLQPGMVASVSGQEIHEGIISLNANNTESGQTNAVIIVFDNGYKLLTHPGQSAGVNTTPGAPQVDPAEIEIAIVLTQPVSPSLLGAPPYNPFIFTNLRRTHEVHLPDNPPTSLADPALFGTAHDDSKPAQGRYYRTRNHMPWAIHVVESFDYPVEKADIIQGHIRIVDWAESAGAQFPDWFKNRPGYRNPNYIY